MTHILHSIGWGIIGALIMSFACFGVFAAARDGDPHPDDYQKIKTVMFLTFLAVVLITI